MGSVILKIMRSAWLKVLLALLLAIVFAGWLIVTPSGARFAWNRVCDILPAEVSAESVMGSVWNGLELRGVHYLDSTNDIKLGAVRVGIDWPALAGRRIRVRLAEAQNVYLNIGASQDKDGETVSLSGLLPSPEVVRGITLDRLSVKKLTLQMGETRIDVPEIEAAAALLADDNNRSAYRLESNIASRLRWQHLSGDFRVETKGPLYQLATRLKADTNVGRLKMDGTLFDVLAQARVDLRLIGEGIDFKPLIDADAGLYNLNGALKGSISELSGELLLAQTRTGTGQNFPARGTDLYTQFVLTRAGIKLPRISLRQASHPLLNGDLDLIFAPSLRGQGGFKINQLDLSTIKSNLAKTGIDSDLSLEIGSDQSGQPVADLQLFVQDETWKGRGRLSIDSQRVEVEKVQLRAGDQGMFNLAGFMNLDGAGKFQFDFDSHELDPGIWAPNLQGRINSHGHLKGAVEPIALQADLDFKPGSRLKRQDIAGQLTVDYQDHRLRHADGKLRWGSVNLILGNRKQVLTARFAQLDPGVLIDDLRAPLSGSLILDTKPGKRVFSVEARADDLSYQTFRGRNLVVSANGPLADVQGIRFDAQLDEAVSQDGSQKLENLALIGSLGQHILSTRAFYQGLRINLEERGGYRDRKYLGKLDRLDLDAPGVAQWSLAKPADFRVSETRSTLKGFYLRPVSGEGGLELDLDWDSQTERLLTSGRLQPLDLSLLSGIWPLENVAGEISGQWDLVYSTKPTPVRGKLNLDARNIKIPYDFFAPDEDDVIVIDNQENDDLENDGYVEIESLTLAGEGKGASLDLSVDILQNRRNQAAGHLLLGEIPGLDEVRINAEAWKQITAAGRIQLDLLDLTLIPPLLRDVAISKGQVRGRVELAGRLIEPRIVGDASLQDLNFEAYALELKGQLQNAKLEFDHRQIRLTELNLSTPATEGQLTAVGNISMLDANRGNFDFKVTGEDVQVAGRSDLNASVSPDLKISGTLDTLQVNGSLTVEQAYVAALVNEGVSLSDEVVLEGERAGSSQEPVTQDSGEGIKLNVDVTLADKVRVREAGADVTLGGKLNIRLDGRGVPLGDGKLSIVKGSYKAYGQDLDVDKGRILFAGSPIDNPSLDISAVRKVRIGTVGVLVSGTAKSPRVGLQSDPAMPESEVLSWLVLGQPLADAEKGAAGLLFGVGTTLLTDPDKPGLLERTQTFLDLDQLSVGSGENAANTVVTLGKQLSDKMYVAYEQGVLSLGSTVRVTYQLTPAWALVARSTGFDRSSSGTLFQVQYEKRF